MYSQGRPQTSYFKNRLLNGGPGKSTYVVSVTFRFPLPPGASRQGVGGGVQVGSGNLHTFGGKHIHWFTLTRLMGCTVCLVCLVSTVSGRRKNTLWKASAGSVHKTKQAGREGSQGCLICVWLDCFVLCLLLASALVLLMWMFHKLYELSNLPFFDIYGGDTENAKSQRSYHKHRESIC